jgi:hypothetical protein
LIAAIGCESGQFVERRVIECGEAGTQLNGVIMDPLLQRLLLARSLAKCCRISPGWEDRERMDDPIDVKGGDVTIATSFSAGGLQGS